MVTKAGDGARKRTGLSVRYCEACVYGIVTDSTRGAWLCDKCARALVRKLDAGALDGEAKPDGVSGGPAPAADSAMVSGGPAGGDLEVSGPAEIPGKAYASVIRKLRWQVEVQHRRLVEARAKRLELEREIAQLTATIEEAGRERERAMAELEAELDQARSGGGCSASGLAALLAVVASVMGEHGLGQTVGFCETCLAIDALPADLRDAALELRNGDPA